MADEPPLPDDWEALDLGQCFAEYTRYCREAFLRGEPVVDHFRTQRIEPEASR